MKFNRKYHTSAHAAVKIRADSPPPQLKSAQRRLGECRGGPGGWSLQISRLIGVSKRGEGG